MRLSPFKDEPNETFLGLTPREALISMSEIYMKPFHGDEVFVPLMLWHMQENPDLAWISD